MSTPDTQPRLSLSPDDEITQALTPKLPEWCALSGWHFIAALGVALFFAYHSYMHLFYSDLWGHVAYGEWILQNRKLPTEEPFVNLAAGVPVIATAWGGQVLLALAARSGDNEWLSHLFATTVWVSYLVLARSFWYRTRHGGVALICAFLAWCISFGRHAVIRPEMFGVLCFFTLLWLLAKGRTEFSTPVLRDGRLATEPLPSPNPWLTLIGIAVTFAAWANLHGSSIVGIAFLGCYWLGRSIELFWRDGSWSRFTEDSEWSFFVSALISATLGLSCNPYGIDLLIHTLLFGKHPNLADIVEWFPLKMVSPEGIAAGASWVLGAVLLRHSRVAMRAGDVCALGLMALAVSAKVRMIAWYAPVAMWVFAPHMADVISQLGFDRMRRERFPFLSLRSFRWSAVILLLAWITMCFTPINRVVLGNGRGRDDKQLYSRGTPIELTHYLRELPPEGLVCGPQWWGDWLVWQGPQKIQLMVTTNSVHVVPPRVWKDYLSIANAQATTESLLARYRINTVIADKQRQVALIKWLTSSSAWSVVYEDDIGLVAARKNSQLATTTPLDKSVEETPTESHSDLESPTTPTEKPE